MSEEIVLPPPGLLIPDVLNLGHTIRPAFVDARDWGEFLPDLQTYPVEYDEVDTSAVDAAARAAEEIAMASTELAERLGDKRREVLAVTQRSDDRDTDYPVVIVYDYTDDLVHEVAVDVDSRAVRNVTTGRSMPALSSREEQRAIELVRTDGRLVERGIDVATGSGIIIEETNFHDPTYGHRLVDLRFGPEDTRYPTAYAIVDLSAERVLRVGVIPQEES
ncbi:MAG TPA: hypothetical protein VIU87_18670 [Mycobacterium sp.]